jgi:hypothetical protein
MGAVITVHILYAGWPLCRFNFNVPAQWPKGHKWVGIHDARLANCPTCVEEHAKLKGGVETRAKT